MDWSGRDGGSINWFWRRRWGGHGSGRYHSGFLRNRLIKRRLLSSLLSPQIRRRRRASLMVAVSSECRASRGHRRRLCESLICECICDALGEIILRSFGLSDGGLKLECAAFFVQKGELIQCRKPGRQLVTSTFSVFASTVKCCERIIRSERRRARLS